MGRLTRRCTVSRAEQGGVGLSMGGSLPSRLQRTEFGRCRFPLRLRERITPVRSVRYDLGTVEACDTYLPRALSPIAERWTRWTDTGMQLAVWLRRRPGGA